MKCDVAYHHLQNICFRFLHIIGNNAVKCTKFPMKMTLPKHYKKISHRKYIARQQSSRTNGMSTRNGYTKTSGPREPTPRIGGEDPEKLPSPLAPDCCVIPCGFQTFAVLVPRPLSCEGTFDRKKHASFLVGLLCRIWSLKAKRYWRTFLGSLLSPNWSPRARHLGTKDVADPLQIRPFPHASAR